MRIGAVICTFRHRFGAFGEIGDLPPPSTDQWGPVKTNTGAHLPEQAMEPTVKTTTCYDAFNAGRTLRAESPLREGRYKLNEAMRDIECWLTLIGTITEHLRSGIGFGAYECIGPCMAYERATYLKSIPTRLAHLIGHKILPGLAALEGDGVHKAEVQRLLSRAETYAQRLLADCEAARLRLKGGIKHEYIAMRRGESGLLPVLDHARSLAALR